MNHRSPSPRDAMPDWSEVSTAAPCPRCGASSRCSTADGGTVVRCFTVVSSYPVAAGGWLHQLTPAGSPAPADRHLLEV